jgi:hypothetical protein
MVSVVSAGVGVTWLVSLVSGQGSGLQSGNSPLTRRGWAG